MTEDKKHYRLSPSGSHRWLVCPGSLTLPHVDRTSDYSAEGTDAHELAAAWISNGLIEYKRQNDDGEMADAVLAYDEFVSDASDEIYPDEYSPSRQFWHVEKRLVSKTIPDFGGTADCILLYKDQCHIIDFKYGAGVKVEAVNNPQLLCYAVLALEQWPDIQSFKLSIFQPRTPGEPASTWEVDRETVEAFRVDVLLADQASRRDKPPFQAGSHCKWCPAVTNCDEVYEITLEAAKTDFDALPTEELRGRLRELYELKPAIEALLKAVPGRILGDIQNGEVYEGLKAVNSYGNRRFVHDEATTLKKLASRGIGKRKATTAKLLSPAQLEKAGYGDAIADLIERPHKGLALVKESDRREAVTFAKPAEQFSDLSEME